MPQCLCLLFMKINYNKILPIFTLLAPYSCGRISGFVSNTKHNARKRIPHIILLSAARNTTQVRSFHRTQRKGDHSKYTALCRLKHNAREINEHILLSAGRNTTQGRSFGIYCSLQAETQRKGDHSPFIVLPEPQAHMVQG